MNDKSLNPFRPKPVSPPKPVTSKKPQPNPMEQVFLSAPRKRTERMDTKR